MKNRRNISSKPFMVSHIINGNLKELASIKSQGRRNHMVVGFTTTCEISAYHH